AIDHNHGLDMQQVWAEVYAMWKAGEGYYLLPDEMAALNAHNEEFTVADPIEQRIQRGLDWESIKQTWEWKSATEVLLMLGVDRPSKSDVTSAGIMLAKLNGGERKKTKICNLLLVPPKMDSSYQAGDRPY